MKLRLLSLLAVVLSVGAPARATTCHAEDFETRVSGASQCLVMRRFGVAAAPEAMVVWLHGDVSSGGPATYHFAAAERAALALAARNVVSVALLRPGYQDASGNASTVAFSQSGRSDHYTRDNIAEVATAIERLRERYKPRKVIAVGHSGGAATTAVLLGLKPGLIDAAVLVACPCDTVSWRAGRKSWSRSENPIRWADKVDPSARVIALTGERDDNTSPELARAYVEVLAARKVDAVFRPVPDETHNGAFASPLVLGAVEDLLAGK